MTYNFLVLALLFLKAPPLQSLLLLVNRLVLALEAATGEGAGDEYGIHAPGALQRRQGRRADDIGARGDDRARVEHEHAVQDAELEIESLQFETTTRQLAVDRQRLVVAELQRQVDDLVIRSPVTGIVGNVAVTQKALVNENAPLITVVDLSAFEVEVLIPEAYADDLGIGLGSDVKYNNAEYRGELVSLSPEVVNGEVVGRIRFAGDMPPGLRQNQRVTVRIMMDELIDVLKLQRGAFADTAGGRTAFVLGTDGLAHRRAIRLGARSVGEVEVIQGLAEGERVIVSSIADFEDYDTIQVVD